MKKTIVPICLLGLLACNNQGVDENRSDRKDSVKLGSISTPSSGQLIKPGYSIGHLVIGSSTDSAIAILGSPDSSDAAMGSALMAWYSKDANQYRTAIFAGRNMGNDEVSRIKRIMVSSPWFTTADGIATGSSLEAIEKKYSLKPVDDATAKSKGLMVFDDTEKGIAFDIDTASKICKAISVHKPGEGASSYINMH
ncbi:MAG: hypothetical protein J7578_11765 [Chitinophagaceae bacterium]|nr:hypothetical protein [Chitinophagaceae bacterium]